MIPLLLSLAILLLVPWLYLKAQRFVHDFARYEGWLNISILLITLIGFLPQQIQRDGLYGFLYLALVTSFFMLIERLLSLINSKYKSALLVPLGTALFIHALFDGLGISLGSSNPGSSGHHAHDSLIAAIVLHRIPACMGIWTFLYPRYGLRPPAIMLALLGLGSIFGYVVGVLQNYGQDPSQHTFFLEYLIAGGLLHFGRYSLYHWHQGRTTVQAKSNQA